MNDMGPAATLVDPCPNELSDWAAALDAGLLEVPTDPWDDAGATEPWQFTDKALVNELGRTQRALATLQARWLALLVEAERREATLRVTGLPTASWLTDERTHWARTARDEVRLAVQLDRETEVATALARGELSVEQARAIVAGLDRLPDDLDDGQRHAVAAQLVEFGQEFGPYGLSRLVNRAVEVVAPEVAEEADRRSVERLEAEQHRERYLVWNREPDGAVVLKGRLGKVAGTRLVEVLQAIAGNMRKTAALAGEDVTRAQSHADALGQVVDHYAGCRKVPRRGAGRPRILVTIDHETLCGRLGTATLVNTAEKLSAHEARILACDAGVLPVVLGGDSVPLDVGRTQRLFTSSLRELLIARDQGCAFPGCDRGPADCEGHHIVPWWAGGATSLSNGVLLCPFHHHLIEPEPNAPPEGQWQLRLDARGLPEFGAPEGRGAPPGQRRWRQHHRLTT